MDALRRDKLLKFVTVESRVVNYDRRRSTEVNWNRITEYGGILQLFVKFDGCDLRLRRIRSTPRSYW